MANNQKKYGKPCPGCGKVIGYSAKSCRDCAKNNARKVFCRGCGKAIHANRNRCWDCHLKHIGAPPKRCQDCGKNVRVAARCRECNLRRLSARTQERRRCIDCGAPVPRKVKRCPPCNVTSLKHRRTYRRTPEQNTAMSARLQGTPKPELRGRKRGAETKAKMRACWTDARKEEASRRWQDKGNPGYLHGRKPRPWPRQFNKRLKATIRKRDRYTCQLCRQSFSPRSVDVGVHHIDYDKSNNNPLNLVALCKSCHGKTNFNRPSWQARLVQLQAQRERSGFVPASDHP